MRQRAGGMVPRRVLAALLLLCLAGVVGILLLCLPTTDLRQPPGFKYGIVLDAGSSHTAMFVYKWPADKENDTGIVSQHSMCDVKGGGISSYAKEPSEAGNSLKSCLNQALKDVPKEKHSVTPLYLGATAGMRLLNITNSQESNNVLSSVTSTLKLYPFDFRGAKILSGEDEGVFGWVTANYLLENFIKYGWIGQWIHPKKGTLGAMDLGGASTQITFETMEQIENPQNKVMLRLYGQTYKVYTHSFLCYGRDQILKRLLSKVLKAEEYKPVISNPCWPKGYQKQLSLGDVYSSPCTSTEQPSSYDRKAVVTMEGSGDPATCKRHVESLFRFSNCSFSRCSFDGIFQPNLSGNFIAFSAFFYTVNFIQSVMKRHVASPRDLEEAAQAICNTTWSQLVKLAPDEEKRLPDYCITSTFVHLLTTKGYQFDDETFSKIAFQKKAGDTSIGWALGYMLNLTNMIPADEAGFRKGTEYSSWVVLILLFVVIILTALAAIFCLVRPNKERDTI
ncbi:PREDICTED: ectonucleoside triphosphate diphosphohydrolase 2 [Crocodylus porosus]|uniref:Ectonucleoside triphosphate diphosphohydrolase 2 n=1 Tax=Crocodylus porosus TaxID=8502 RepID=A0A7M4EVL9_CROPO|nr:PREDICTED: ectonucleoside triphosphate diphosphohydrolase 2 [Crocodylus porosus]